MMTLKDLRHSKGLSALEVAKRIGVKRRQYYNIENGVSIVDALKFNKLLEVYGCNADALLVIILNTRKKEG